MPTGVDELPRVVDRFHMLQNVSFALVAHSTNLTERKATPMVLVNVLLQDLSIQTWNDGALHFKSGCTADMCLDKLFFLL